MFDLNLTYVDHDRPTSDRRAFAIFGCGCAFSFGRAWYTDTPYEPQPLMHSRLCGDSTHRFYNMYYREQEEL
jgi:hypothetical protein